MSSPRDVVVRLGRDVVGVLPIAGLGVLHDRRERVRVAQRRLVQLAAEQDQVGPEVAEQSSEQLSSITYAAPQTSQVYTRSSIRCQIRPKSAISAAGSCSNRCWIRPDWHRRRRRPPGGYRRRSPRTPPRPCPRTPSWPPSWAWPSASPSPPAQTPASPRMGHRPRRSRPRGRRGGSRWCTLAACVPTIAAGAGRLNIRRRTPERRRRSPSRPRGSRLHLRDVSTADAQITIELRRGRRVVRRIRQTAARGPNTIGLPMRGLGSGPVDTDVRGVRE